MRAFRLATGCALGAALACGILACPSPKAPGVDGGFDGGGTFDSGPSDDGGSGDAGSDAGVDAGPTPYQAFCDGFTRAVCSNMVTCGVWKAEALAECMDEKATFFCEENELSVAHGYQQFDVARGQACLTQIQALASAGNCSESGQHLLFGDTDCQTMLRPAAAPGGACLQSADCVDPSTGCAQTACGQTCQPAGSVGQPCLAFTSCNSGWCDSSTNECAVFVGLGGACPTGFECDGVTTYCDSTNHCTALPGNNQPCVFGYSCVSGTYCDPTTTCRADPPQGQPCPDGICANGLWCDSNLICQPQLGQGNNCPGGPAQCQPPLTCLAGTCSAALAIGQPCTLDTDCQVYGSFTAFGGCDAWLGKCVYFGIADAGATCTNWEVCPTTTNCVLGDGGAGPAGTCVPTQVGDGCSSNGACPIGAACVAGASGRVCAGADAGASCALEGICPSATYCTSNGTCAPQALHGQPCDTATFQYSQDSCQGSDWCQPVPASDAGICAPAGGDDAGCDLLGSNECLLPDFCSNNHCQPGGQAGQPCAQFGYPLCFGGSCQVDAGLYGLCTPAGQSGQSCYSYADCASGECLTGLCQSCP